MGRLKDKIILVTGAPGAIGSAVGEAVVRAGGFVVATDMAGREGIDHALDVTAEADWARVMAAVETKVTDSIASRTFSVRRTARATRATRSCESGMRTRSRDTATAILIARRTRR